MGIAEDIVIIVIFGLISGLITNKFKFPLFLGYIVTGIIIGPHTGGITVTDTHSIEFLAEIGVALLLFSIGLELRFSELKEVKKIALLGTPVQIILTAGIGFGTGILLGFPAKYSLVLGCIISLSSTMIVLKTLMNRHLTGTLSSRVMIGILIVQDLAAIPILILLPQINNLSGSMSVIILSLIRAFAILAIIIILGIKLIPFILKQVARLNSPELFLLSVTTIGLGVGYIAYLNNLSFALGAFIAGMVLSDSDYSHQAMSDIIPLRDLFGLLFFVSIGILFNPSTLLTQTRTILVLVAAAIAGKALVFFMLTRFFGYYNIIPVASALGLAQIGEFSFVIATLGLKDKIISYEFYSILLSVTIITMFISPFLTKLVEPLYSFIKRKFSPESVQTINFPVQKLINHIVICGGGRVGLSTGEALNRLKMQFVIIENDYKKFENVKAKQFPVIYGDSVSKAVLDAAGISDAGLVILTIPSIMISREVVTVIRKIRSDITIFARTENIEQYEEMLKLNVHELVQPEFEASLEMIRQTLLFYGKPVPEIQNFIDMIRHENYSKVFGSEYCLKKQCDMKNIASLIQMFWIQIPDSSDLTCKTIKETAIRTITGASVIGVFRSDIFYPNPGPDFIFQTSDLVALIGNSESRTAAENLLTNITGGKS